MKLRLLLAVMLVFVMSACSSFRETGVSEDGTIRQIMTEHTEEIDIPSDPDRVVLFRTTDAGNADLLGGNVVGVSNIVKGTQLAKEHLDEGITYLEHGDLEALKALDPDLIVTFAPDEYVFQYEEIAPTVQMSYTASPFSPFRDKLYLTHLHNLGVVLNKQAEAEALGDEWLEETTRFQREAGEAVIDSQALVLVEASGSYYAYGRYSAFGTEAVYDVLNFQMDEALEEKLREGPFEVDIADLDAYEADYVFVNTKDMDSGVARKIADVMGIQEDHVIMQDYEDYRLNDLISIEMQVEAILEQIKP
ncbi:ABC transporter substrate-binding protein [Salinicoccus sp. ID82-1]|uniref:ABC transporter substrate-binding protein n=1 Tax=Salinicoccus cyprini TaxID=2493691 RepID=A0A558ATV1_9STAP|nr:MULTISPECIES: ABC transporter substrate-binding protein [Salinicoccus]MCG1010816.1 ABC transporter substrate-binding protein [Salinicoccus sp. ID82-1]TVT27702.1 ABC transporter substrate-binding protein [Salinicoccus cyprini]